MAIDVQHRLTEAATLDYAEYLLRMEKKIQLARQTLQPVDKIEQIKLNFHRNIRLSRTYTVSGELEARLKSAITPQTWYFLTEDWCGDSNQMLPCLVKMTQENPNIQLKLILRDKNPEVMEQYLTDGKRSIPKLISVDADGNELFIWGPRPKPVQKIFEDSLAENPSKDKAKAKLHAWYAKDKCCTFELEIADRLESLV